MSDNVFDAPADWEFWDDEGAPAVVTPNGEFWVSADGSLRPATSGVMNNGRNISKENFFSRFDAFFKNGEYPSLNKLPT